MTELNRTAAQRAGVSMAVAGANFQRFSEALRESSDSLAKLTEQHHELVVSAVLKGMSESAVARDAGVSRQTVRDWVGKPKRGDQVTAIGYHSDELVQGPYVPRTDHLAARPPADAAWVDDGSDQGPMMVKAASVKVVR